MTDAAGRGRHVALAALAGALATVAATQSPILAALPPLVPPYVALDLRFMILPGAFALSEAVLGRQDGAAGGVATLVPATGAAVANHVHASATLAFAGTPWATSGVGANPLALAATGASVLVALAVTFETGRERFALEARARGVADEQIDRAREVAGRLTRSSLATAAAGLAVLGLGLRLADRLVAGTAIPLHEVAALALVLGLGAVYAGLTGRDASAGG